MPTPSAGAGGETPAVDPDTGLSAAEVRLRAIRGVLSLAFREVILRGMGLVGNVVIARLLAPRQFGVVAFGYTLIQFSYFVSDGGVGAKLIQRSEPPTARELRALQGLTLAISGLVCVVIAAIGLFFGTPGHVAAVMSLSVPLSAVAAPATILAERTISYRPIVRSDILQTLSYNIIAITLVALGLGVWGLAIGLDVSVALGSLVLLAQIPGGWVRPGLGWGRLKPIIRYGLEFQAAGLVSLLRDQGLNILVAVVSGLPVLGIWSLAGRILQGITLLFSALWRVSFPAIARLIDAGEDPVPSVRRALSLATTATGFAVILVGGCAPALVPLAFGHRWTPAVAVLPWVAAGLLVSGPLTTSATSLLYARGDVRLMLWSVSLQAVTWLAVAVALLPALGAEAIGIGSAAGAAVDLIYLSRVLDGVGVPVFRAMRAPALACYGASAVAWLVAIAIPPPAPALLAALVAGVVSYVVALRLLAPSALGDLVDTLRRARRGGRADAVASH